MESGTDSDKVIGVQSLGRFILRVVVGLAIFLFLTSLVMVLLLLILNDHLLKSVKNVVAFVTQLGLASFLLLHVKARINAGIAKGQSFSRALHTFLIEEPVFHAIVWLVAVAQLLILVFFSPIYKVVLHIELPRPELRASILSEAVEFHEKSIENDRLLILESDRVFYWGDSIHIPFNTDGRETITITKWPILSFLNVFQGQRFGPITLYGDKANIKIQCDPSTATVSVTSGASIDTTLVGSCLIEVPTKTWVTISVSETGYLNETVSLHVETDTTLTITLSKLDGYLRLHAVNEGGVAVNDLDIFIDGQLVNYELGARIRLSSGNHSVRLAKRRGRDTLFVPEFTVAIQPGSTYDDTKQVVVVRDR